MLWRVNQFINKIWRWNTTAFILEEAKDSGWRNCICLYLIIISIILDQPPVIPWTSTNPLWCSKTNWYVIMGYIYEIWCVSSDLHWPRTIMVHCKFMNSNLENIRYANPIRLTFSIMPHVVRTTTSKMIRCMDFQFECTFNLKLFCLDRPFTFIVHTKCFFYTGEIMPEDVTLKLSICTLFCKHFGSTLCVTTRILYNWL